MTAFTDATITDSHRLQAELDATRMAGYGVGPGELETSLFGVSAPVLDAKGRPLAIVSIWGPRERVTEARFPVLGEVVRSAAAEISRVRQTVAEATVAL